MQGLVWGEPGAGLPSALVYACSEVHDIIVECIEHVLKARSALVNK